jgi:hypothetical protein
MMATLVFLAATFPFFWFHSFESTLRLRVFKQWAPQAQPEVTYDAIPSPISWTGAGALVWVCLLGTLVIFGEGNCSLRSDTLFSFRGGSGVLAVMLTSKIVFGPSSSTFKSMMLSNERKLVRPISYILFDYATVYPVSKKCAREKRRDNSII